MNQQQPQKLEHLQEVGTPSGGKARVELVTASDEIKAEVAHNDQRSKWESERAYLYKALADEAEQKAQAVAEKQSSFLNGIRLGRGMGSDTTIAGLQGGDLVVLREIPNTEENGDEAE